MTDGQRKQPSYEELVAEIVAGGRPFPFAGFPPAADPYAQVACVPPLRPLGPLVEMREGVLPFQKPNECADLDPDERRTFVSRPARFRTHSRRLVIAVDKAVWLSVVSVAVGPPKSEANPNPGFYVVLDDELEGRLFLESYVGAGVNVLPSFVVEVGQVVYLEMRNLDSDREVTLENLVLLTLEERPF